jgi:hypothetical protein
MHFCGGQSGNGTSLSPGTLIITCQFCFTHSPYSPSSLCNSYHTMQVNPGNPHSNGLLKVGECYTEDYSHTAFECKASPHNFCGYKQATHQVVLKVLWFSACIISSMLHTLTEQTHQLQYKEHTLTALH